MNSRSLWTVWKKNFPKRDLGTDLCIAPFRCPKALSHTFISAHLCHHSWWGVCRRIYRCGDAVTLGDAWQSGDESPVLMVNQRLVGRGTHQRYFLPEEVEG